MRNLGTADADRQVFAARPRPGKQRHTYGDRRIGNVEHRKPAPQDLDEINDFTGLEPVEPILMPVPPDFFPEFV